VAWPPGDFGRLPQADIPTAAITKKHAEANVHALRVFIFPRAAKSASDKLVSSTAKPLTIPGNDDPGRDGICSGPGAPAVQNVFTTIAICVPFPVKLIVPGTSAQVMSGEGLVHPSVTVPVVPGVDVSSKPKTAPPPGVVLTVVGAPGATVIVTGEFPLLNVAVTDCAADSVTEHPAVPEQPAPLHPAKVDPSAAFAVSATTWPLAKLAEHVDGHAIPAGALVTVPVPLPASVTVKVKFVVDLANVAVTMVAAVSVTTQVPVPSHGALHPANVEPLAGAAVKVIAVPLAKFAVQVDGQAIPAGALVTVPVPVPASATVSAKFVVLCANVAVTEVAAVSVTTQVPVPEHGAPQPVNVDPVAGAAVSVTWVPLANGAEQVAPQLIPAGALVTVPVPVPAFVTVKVKFVVVAANVAVTEVAAVTVTRQVPVPEHGAPQPVNVDPVAGAAIKVTCVPLANGAAHVAPQLIPAGALVTVPVPVPAFVTVKVKFVVLSANVAVTLVAAASVTTHVPVPEHGALQPLKVDPVAGAAVKVTCVPLANGAAHVAPQLIPAGALVTVPVPVPALVTVKVKFVAVTVNVAVTEVAAVTVTTQVPVPGHGAPQPVKVDPVAGAAVKVTCVPLANGAAHVAPQLIQSRWRRLPQHFVFAFHQTRRVAFRRHMLQLHVMRQRTKQRNPAPDQHRHTVDRQPIHQSLAQKTLNGNPSIKINMFRPAGREFRQNVRRTPSHLLRRALRRGKIDGARTQHHHALLLVRPLRKRLNNFVSVAPDHQRIHGRHEFRVTVRLRPALIQKIKRPIGPRQKSIQADAAEDRNGGHSHSLQSAISRNLPRFPPRCRPGISLSAPHLQCGVPATPTPSQWEPGQEGDPSSRKALLWMTAKSATAMA
jgi:hypothetical protein